MFHTLSSQNRAVPNATQSSSVPRKAVRRTLCQAARPEDSAPRQPARKSERSHRRGRKQGSVAIQPPELPSPAPPIGGIPQPQQQQGVGTVEDSLGSEEQSNLSWWREAQAAEEEEADRSRAADAARSNAAILKEEDGADEELTEAEQRAKDAFVRKRVAAFFESEGIASDVDRNIDSGNVSDEEDERPMVQAAEFWDRPIQPPAPVTGGRGFDHTRGFEPGSLWDAEVATGTARGSASIQAASSGTATTAGFETGNLWDAELASKSGTDLNSTVSPETAHDATREQQRPTQRAQQGQKAPRRGSIEDVVAALEGQEGAESRQGAEPDLARALRGVDMSEEEVRGRALTDLATEGADVEALINRHRDIIDEDLLVTLYGRVEAAHKYGEGDAVVGALLALWRRLRSEVERGMASPSERLLDEALQLLTDPAASQLQQLEGVSARLAAAFFPPPPPAEGGGEGGLDLFAIAESLASGGEGLPLSADGPGTDVEHVQLDEFMNEVGQLLDTASEANTGLQQLVDSRELSKTEQEAAEDGLKDRLLSAEQVQTILAIADTLRSRPTDSSNQSDSRSNRHVTF